MRTPGKGEVLGVVAAVSTLGGFAGCGGSLSSTSPETAHKAPRGPAKINRIEKGPSANITPFKGILHCVAIDPSKQWAPTPTNMDAPLIAQSIGRGVKPEQVEEGQMGAAECSQGITVGEVDQTKATVKGIGDLCIVVGLGSAPETDKIYHKVLAVCAAESVPIPSTTE